MAQQPFWGGDLAEEQAWNFVWIDDLLLPGIATVKIGKSRQIDKIKSKSKDGVHLKDLGCLPAEISIELTIYTADQWEAYQEIIPLLDPQQAGGTRRPHNITHPECAAHGIDTIYIEKVEGNPPSPKDGKKEIFTCVEWFPEPKATKASSAPPKGEPSELDDDPVVPEVNTLDPH